MIHVKYVRTNVNTLEEDGRAGEWNWRERESISTALLSHSEVRAHERALGRVGASWPGARLTAEAEATPQICILSNPMAHYTVPSLGLPYALFSSLQYRGSQH